MAIEVKFTVRLDQAALAGIRACREALGQRLRLAVILYGGYPRCRWTQPL